MKRASGVTEERAEKRTAGAAFGGATMKDGPVGVVAKDGSGGFSPFGRRPPDGPVGVRPKPRRRARLARAENDIWSMGVVQFFTLSVGLQTQRICKHRATDIHSALCFKIIHL